MFHHAKDTKINSSSFTVNNHFGAPNSNVDVGREIKHLSEKIASNAFHNSKERFDSDPPRCHPETRIAILTEIKNWIQNDERDLFLWLYGPAGSGKTSIAQSIAEWCCQEGVLATSFFFSRTRPGRNNDRLLIATLAYQLTILIPDTRQHIAQALNWDPSIFDRSLPAQLETLILKPLAATLPKDAAPQDPPSRDRPKLGPIFVFLDGLDECGESKTQRHIVTEVAKAIPGTSLFFLIASRPEEDIRQAFHEEPLNSVTHRIVLDDTYNPDADIKVFLISKFDEVKKKHPTLPASWPSDADVGHIIQKSSGQFIYASTVMNFVESPCHPPYHQPAERLKVVLGLKPPGNTLPFAELDTLYSLILSSAHDTKAVIDILTFLLLFSSHGSRRTDMVEKSLGHEPGYLRIILANLHSIIHVPEYEDDLGQLSLFHASLGDFLTDKARSGSFYIDIPGAHACFARYCIWHTGPELCIRLDASHSPFLEHCSKAAPTEDLLQDLYNFNFFQFLTAPTIGISTLVRDLPPFFLWLKERSHGNDNNELYQRYITHFDNFLITQLSRYPQCTASGCLFTALTLPEFPELSSETIFRIVTESRKRESHSREMCDLMNTDQKVLQIGHLSEYSGRCADYHSTLVAFFRDPVRSGIYHVDESSYVSLADKCLRRLKDPSRVRGGLVENCILNLLPSILLRISVHDRLELRKKIQKSPGLIDKLKRDSRKGQLSSIPQDTLYYALVSS